MKQIRKILWQGALSFCLFACASTCAADEVVLDDGDSDDQVKLGDYNYSVYRTGASSNFPLQDQEITAGQLWKFFDQQGLDSVRSIAICVDVDRLPADQQLDLRAMDLLIEDPSDKQRKCHYSMGDKNLVFPANKTKSFTAEGRFELDLGYDFMTRYSSASTESVQLNFALDHSGTSAPVFFIEGKRGLFSLGNMIMLTVFCSFWVGLFWLLQRFTLPAPKKSAPPVSRPVLTLPRVEVVAEPALDLSCKP